eukprot:6490905-Amphidinium_carterae.1
MLQGAPLSLTAQPEVHDALRMLDGWVLSMREERGETGLAGNTRGQTRWRHSTEKLLLAVQASFELKGGARKLHFAVKRAIQLTAPPMLVKTLLQLCEQQKSPSKSTIHRAEFGLDMAISLLKKQTFQPRCYRYLWTDSSPSSDGRDYLWCQMHEIPADHVITTAKAANTLASLGQTYIAREDECELDASTNTDAEGSAEERQQDGPKQAPQLWRPLLKELLHVREYMFAPAALASGHRTVAHKVSALCHMFHFAVADERKLTDLTHTVLSHTSDMGVELSVPGFSCASPDTLLPPWVNREELVSGTADNGAAKEPGPLPQETFLPYALQVYGIQHLVDNVNRDCHVALKGWTRFHQQLKCLEAFICSTDRRERYVATCLADMFHFKEKALFLRRFGTKLYDKRWHVVMKFLRRALPFIRILASTWNERSYTMGGEGSGKQADTSWTPAALTEVLGDAMFHRYVGFVLRVEEVGEVHLGQWAEGCNCHEKMFHSKGRAWRESACRVQFGEGWSTCPMAGKRAAELVCGRLSEVLESAWQVHEADIVAGRDAPYPLEAKDLEQLLLDVRLARAAQTTWLAIKLDYLQRTSSQRLVCKRNSFFVSSLCVGKCICKARECGKVALAAFKRDPRGPPAQHPLTWHLLNSSSLFRQGLDSFLAGQNRWECNSVFVEQVAAWRFVPITETTIEAKHSKVSLASRTHAIQPARVSLSNRMFWLERELKREPTIYEKLLRAFQDTRALRAIPSLFQIDAHPSITAAIEHDGMPTATCMPVLVPLIYRCDLDSTFYSWGAELKAHEKEHNKQHRAEVKLLVQEHVRDGFAGQGTPHQQPGQKDTSSNLFCLPKLVFKGLLETNETQSPLSKPLHVFL